MNSKPKFSVVRATTSTGRSALYGYAVLRTNFNHSAPSYLDNFLAFVVDVLAAHEPGGASSRTVGQGLRETFGLTVPDQAAGVLLTRAVKSGKATRVSRDLYALAAGAAPAVSLVESISQFRQKQDTLRARFLDFVAARHEDSLSLIEGDPDGPCTTSSSGTRYPSSPVRSGVHAGSSPTGPTYADRTI